jgi:hypothetical protein
MAFKDTNCEIIRNVVSKDTLKLVAHEFDIIRKLRTKEFNVDEFTHIGDNQVPNAFTWYGAYCTEGLLLLLHDKIQSVVEKRLHPAYSFARIYYNGATLERHHDRPSCQYSATLCITADETPWPIYIEDKNGVVLEADLKPGDMAIYRGDHLYHWRNEYEGKQQLQAFLHYVDADGIYKDNIYDGRYYLGLSPVADRQQLDQEKE